MRRTRRLLAGALSATTMLGALALGSIAAQADDDVPLTTQPVIADPTELVMPYVVVTDAKKSALAEAESTIRNLGGTVVSSYPQVGVVVAYAGADDFAARLRQSPGIEEVGATRTAKIAASWFGQRSLATFTGAPYPRSNEVPAEGTAWDTVSINVAKAHEVTMGSRDVVVGVLDTGVDDTHPQLAHAVDTSLSVTCTGGWADTTFGAWRNTRDGHGTHIAGTIAAAKDGVGTVGIAPGVRVASVKMADADDQETPESEVCGYIWAAEHGFKVVNNSYRSYPWRFACPSDIDQHAIITAVSRAVAYAQDRNVLFVSSAGNAQTDWDFRTADSDSPADTKPVRRTIDTSCLRLPHHLPGVIGVSAIDPTRVKSSFSNFGFDSVGLGAPGSNTWSTWPNGQFRPASGTSMASPQVVGVAALVASRYPLLTAEQIRQHLFATAAPAECPTRYSPATAVCRTEGDRTNFYGAGIVDANNAVRTAPKAGPGTAYQVIEAELVGGPLTLETSGDGLVSFGQATLNGRDQALQAALHALMVLDGRGTGAGWSLTGQAGDLAGSSGGTILADNVGWVPSAGTVSGDLPAAPGSAPEVQPGSAASPGAGTGLGGSQMLCSAPVGHSSGAFECGGALLLGVPGSTPAGQYMGVLTLTLV